MGQCCSSSLQKFSDQDYSSIRNSLLSDGSLWCDPTFPASNHLLPASCQDCVWLRPKDICEKLRGREREEFGVPEMGCRSRQNVNQGEIGNCWFLSVLAGLAENKHLFDAVVPPGQGFENDYCGLFRFRFFRLGVWYEVVIDDRLPTRNGHLVFLRGGQPNQFWPALFEKAYAKFYGGYHNIEGGNSVEAGVDFSGG